MTNPSFENGLDKETRDNLIKFLTEEQKKEAARIGRISFKSAGAVRKSK